MIPKFRAWDKECMEMANVTDINYKGNWVVDEPHVVLDTRCDLLPFDEVELMQFTGLKDKNGVEIFEGDVVLVSVQNGFDYLNNKKTVVQKSEFHSGLICKSLDIGMEYRVFNCNEAGYEYEVIGNIYENSELLEEQR